MHVISKDFDKKNLKILNSILLDKCEFFLYYNPTAYALSGGWYVESLIIFKNSIIDARFFFKPLRLL